MLPVILLSSFSAFLPIRILMLSFYVASSPTNAYGTTFFTTFLHWTDSFFIPSVCFAWFLPATGIDTKEVRVRIQCTIRIKLSGKNCNKESEKRKREKVQGKCRVTKWRWMRNVSRLMWRGKYFSDFRWERKT